MSLDLTNSVVLITGSDQGRFGTGFTVYQDKDATYLLTCAHVVEDVGGPEELKVGGSPAKVIASGAEDGIDLAILQVDRLLNVFPMDLSNSERKDCSFITVGHHLYGEDILTEDVKGILGKKVRLNFKGKASRIKAWYLIIADNYQLQSGYSGAPVIDEKTQVVLGIVVYKEGREGKKGLAISVEAVDKVWTERPVGLFIEEREVQRPLIPKNPFFYGNPVYPTEFLNRRQSLHWLERHLLSSSWPVVIVGEPRVGKTSLLLYLAARKQQTSHYTAEDGQLFFSYLDMLMLDRKLAPSKFWEQALAPIEEQLVHFPSDSLLVQWYQICHNNHFGNFTLETLFQLFNENKQRLVLLLDGIDELLKYDIPGRTEFFGGLRTLAFRSDGALSLIITSRLPLSVLNVMAEEFNYPGFSYFNGFEEIRLGAFPKIDVSRLLELGSKYFTLNDQQAIRTIAGGHPYLLQTAAAAMWDAWEEEGLKDDNDRRYHVGKRLYRENKSYFIDTWQVWLPQMRKAFTFAALVDISYKLSKPIFLTNPLIESLRDCELELDDLEATGLLAHDEHAWGGWRVAAEAMLWWLADEFVRASRANTPIENWLKAQALDDLLTYKEKQQLEEMILETVQVFRRGAIDMIEKFAKDLDVESVNMSSDE